MVIFLYTVLFDAYVITAIIIEGFQELKNPLDYLAVTFLLSFVLDVQVSFVLP